MPEAVSLSDKVPLASIIKAVLLSISVCSTPDNPAALISITLVLGVVTFKPKAPLIRIDGPVCPLMDAIPLIDELPPEPPLNEKYPLLSNIRPAYFLTLKFLNPYHLGLL